MNKVIDEVKSIFKGIYTISDSLCEILEFFLNINPTISNIDDIYSFIKDNISDINNIQINIYAEIFLCGHVIRCNFGNQSTGKFMDNYFIDLKLLDITEINDIFDCYRFFNFIVTLKQIYGLLCYEKFIFDFYDRITRKKSNSDKVKSMKYIIFNREFNMKKKRNFIDIVSRDGVDFIKIKKVTTDNPLNLLISALEKNEKK